MLLLSGVLLFFYAMACWFTQPFDESFLGLPIFDLDAWIPFSVAVFLALAALVKHIVSQKALLNNF